MGISAGRIPTAMKASTPSFGHCLGNACFQSTKVAKTALASPVELLSKFVRILLNFFYEIVLYADSLLICLAWVEFGFHVTYHEFCYALL